MIDLVNPDNKAFMAQESPRVLMEEIGENLLRFKTLEGKRGSISGATQIRAGVIRPEVIVPAEEEAEKAAEKQEAGALEIGNKIRIIREPHLGRIGEVTALPPELTRVESETTVRILKMKFPDGEEVVLPRANIELIED